MKVLLHICCAACAIGPWEQMTAQGHEVVGYFYNPNVHPLIEFRRRKKSVKVLQERMPIPVIYEEDYGLRDHLGAVRWASANKADRCEDCYRLRLDRTAKLAAHDGFDAITTTLLGSKQQDHPAVARIGQECATRHGVAFYYADWRPLADESHHRAQDMRLYLQSYCGCVFSEQERYADTTLHEYKGQGPGRALSED